MDTKIMDTKIDSPATIEDFFEQNKGITVDAAIRYSAKYSAIDLCRFSLNYLKHRNTFVEGDWAVYNWLDDDGNDNWKVGRIINTLNHGSNEERLMYFNEDDTIKCGYVPITEGVIRINHIL